MMDKKMSNMTWAYHGHAPGIHPILLKSDLPLRLLRPIINTRPIKLSLRPAKSGPIYSNERTPFGRKENRKFRKRTKNVRRVRVPDPRVPDMAKGKAGGLGGCRKIPIRANSLSPMNALELAL